MPDFECYYERMMTKGSRANIFYSWLAYKSASKGYQTFQFYEYFSRFIVSIVQLKYQKVFRSCPKIPTGKNLTVSELVAKYLSTKTGAKLNAKMNYNFVRNILLNEPFGEKRSVRSRPPMQSCFSSNCRRTAGGTAPSRPCVVSSAQHSRWRWTIMFSSRTLSTLNAPEWW